VYIGLYQVPLLHNGASSETLAKMKCVSLWEKTKGKFLILLPIHGFESKATHFTINSSVRKAKYSLTIFHF
jgi:hypothetical protein